MTQKGVTYVAKDGGVFVTHVAGKALKVPQSLGSVDFNNVKVAYGVDKNGYVDDRFIKVFAEGGSPEGLRFKVFESGDIDILRHKYTNGTVRREWVGIEFDN